MTAGVDSPGDRSRGDEEEKALPCREAGEYLRCRVRCAGVGSAVEVREIVMGPVQRVESHRGKIVCCALVFPSRLVF